MGTMFPKMQIGKTCVMGSPIQTPTGMAPRSSTTGMAEIVLRTAHLGRPKLMKKLAIFCPVWRCSTVSTAAFLAAKAGLLVKKVRATRATAERLKTFETDFLTETLSFLFLLKAFPMEENERFKLVLVSGDVTGRVFDKVGARKPNEGLVVWNAAAGPHATATSTRMHDSAQFNVLIMIVVFIDFVTHL